MTLPEARDLATDLAVAATGGRTKTWAAGALLLEALDGRSWLLLDEAARSLTYASGSPVSGTRGWLGPPVSEPTGFVAAITSLHVDGRIRQRATRLLAERAGRLPASALAVRTLDQVPQVRDEAKRALLALVDADPDVAEPVLGVLLAGRGRKHVHAALESVRSTLLDRMSAADLVSTLKGSGERDVRRWTFLLGHEQRVLTSQELLTAVQSDPDQWLRSICAQWLVEVAEPRQLCALLRVRTVEARLHALTRIPDDVLSDDDLVQLLADRAARVREQARLRARRRGIDAADWYRGQLAAPTGTAQTLAACLDGLAVVGGPQDLQSFMVQLRHRSVRVRAAAVTGVSAHATGEQVLGVLQPVLLDSSPRVSATAARALARLRTPAAAADVAWASAQPWSRRAAWRLSRATGGWDRVEADLRAAGDTDPALASLGLTGIGNWLDTSAATTWDVLPDPQRARLRQLLETGALDDATCRMVAFHARIPRPEAPRAAVEDDATASATGPARRWLRLLRGH